MRFASAQVYDEIQTELASYETPLTGLETDRGLCAEVGCGEGCGGNCCCTTGGMTLQAELLFFRAYESEGEADTSRYDAAYRLSGGWKGDSGTGVRIRWFEYATNTYYNDYDVYGLDAEITGDYQLNCDWSGLLALGVRHSSFEQDTGKFRTLAWGPSIAGELRRPLFCQFDLFGAARYAMLFGENNVYYADVPSSTTSGYGELQVGLECQRCVGRSTMFARAVFEGQRWSGAVDRTMDLGLFGGSFSIGISH